MEETDIKPGDILLLTRFYEEYICSKKPCLIIRLQNRLAKLEDIIDWSSSKGKKLKEVRIKSGKWDDLPLEDNKYIVSIFYPELTGRKGQSGVVEMASLFRNDPLTGSEFFIKADENIIQSLMINESYTVTVDGENITYKVPKNLVQIIIKDPIKFDIIEL